MDKLFVSILLFFLLSNFSSNGQGKGKYVNPFIGTSPTPHPSKWDGHGRTYPGAVVPHGFVQLTPETRVLNEKGYDYRDTSIYFFSCWSHCSGYPNGSSGHGQILPVENTQSISPRPFSHSSEVASPGYYKVSFSDNGTAVETAASTRAGMFRFSYKEKTKPKIFVGGFGEIVLEGRQTVKADNRNGFFRFNVPWTNAEKNGEGYVFTFDFPADSAILLKLATSSVSFTNAQNNLEKEIPSWDFDALKEQAHNQWEEILSVVDVDDPSDKNKTIFYTALYHSMLVPWIISDVDGSYMGADKIVSKTKGKNQYGVFSPWDTFRSLHPLLCILQPDAQTDMINSILDDYLQTGRLPLGPMTGYHTIPVIVDSYFKGCDGFDTELAYKAMREVLMESPWRYGDMPTYIANGYVPATYQESVTRTVEYTYNDWALSRFAKNLNKAEDYKKLQKRALNYQNLFDPEQLFIVPRDKDSFVFSTTEFGYKEGDKWNYSLFVPQDIQGLVNLKGGSKAFVDFLDNAIKNNHIIFDNEPNFHIPYLFNYAEKPAKTQEWVSKIREILFTDGTGGLPGNDDLGSMSSWYVFNALGFFPVTPGVPQYNIGTPMFKKVTIHLNNGENFVVEADSISEKNKYIQSATLNGTTLGNYWFSHSTLENGGEIVLQMGAKPSNWGENPQENAFSITTGQPSFSVGDLQASTKKVFSNEIFLVKFTLENKGTDGVKIVRLLADGKVLATKNVFVGEGQTATGSVACKLYSPGKTRLKVEGSKIAADVKVIDSGKSGFEYSGLRLKSLLRHAEKQNISFEIKNIGAKNDVAKIEVLQNNELVVNDKISLSPGQNTVLYYSFPAGGESLNKIVVDSLEGFYKIVAKPLDASLCEINFQHKKSGILVDKSGLGNNGILRGEAWGRANKFDGNSFVEIKNSGAFYALDTSITMMAWIKPSAEKRGQSSIVTQGDFNVIQMSQNRNIDFFAGGWGRGECNATLPVPITDEWHHITGVCDGVKLNLYLDGELIATTVANNKVSLKNNSNWNVGENEEFPGRRTFAGEIDGIKIFASALSENEIKEIINKSGKKYHKK